MSVYSRAKVLGPFCVSICDRLRFGFSQGNVTNFLLESLNERKFECEKFERQKFLEGSFEEQSKNATKISLAVGEESEIRKYKTLLVHEVEHIHFEVK